MKQPSLDAMEKRLRSFCLALPEVDETAAFGHPNFRAGGRTFCVWENYKGRPSIAFKATLPEQGALTADERFYVTPYVGKHGWISLWVETDFAWSMVEDLALRAYRHVANPRMLAALEEKERGTRRRRR